jgi:transcriptional regulator with XRE-family HTH domain
MSISQEELAERAGLHRNYVGSCERGERDIGISALNQLVTALGLSLADFFAPFRSRNR